MIKHQIYQLLQICQNLEIFPEILDLAKKMIRLAGLIPDRDIEIKIVGLRPGEKLYEELLNNSAKSIATHHEKIMIAIEGCDEFQIINQHVEELIQIATVGNLNQLVSKMKTIVPEYKSLNSVYQILDVELKETPNYNNLENYLPYQFHVLFDDILEYLQNKMAYQTLLYFF